MLSDIHGFTLALDAVLADIDSVGVDRIIAAGDLCEAGPDPVGVLDRLAARGIEAIQGNTDRDIGNGVRTSATARYTMQMLGEDGLRTLRELPFSIRVTPPDGSSPEDDLLVVHANPFDQDQKLDPNASDREIRALLGDTQAAVIAFGHIHISYTRQVDEHLLVDVAAVGNPKDGDFRPRWGLFTWNAEAHAWSVETRYVDYPLDETIAQIDASGLPNSNKAIAKLIRASY